MSKTDKPGKPEVDFVATTFIRSWNLIKAYGTRRFMKNLNAGNATGFNQVVANIANEREDIGAFAKKLRDEKKSSKPKTKPVKVELKRVVATTEFISQPKQKAAAPVQTPAVTPTIQ